MAAEWRVALEKQFGKGCVKQGSDIRHRGYRGSGSIALDVALGGGWGRAKIVQLQGKEGGGKTLLWEMAAVEAQKVEGKRSALFDFEGTFDPTRFVALGGDLDMLDLFTHENFDPMMFAEGGFDVVKTLVSHSTDHATICFDSTGAMISIHEYESKMEDGQEKATPFHTAKAMSDGLKITLGMISRNAAEPTVFFVSQGRDNINGRGFKGMPPPDKQTGGRALPYYASQRIEVSKGEVLKGDVDDDATGRKEKQVEVGFTTRVKVKKNKLNRFQGRVAQFDVYSEGEVRGLDRVGELAGLAIYTKVVEQSGSWFEIAAEYNDDELDRVQGRDNLERLIARPAVYQTVYAATRERLARMMDNSSAPEEDGFDGETYDVEAVEIQ